MSSKILSQQQKINRATVISDLPTFPESIQLNASHQYLIETYVSEYEPYSDYNFISLWAWDYENKIKISQLHGNLIVRFQNYVDPTKYFYSFLGENHIHETIDVIYNHPQNTKAKLELIPEIVASQIRSDSGYVAQEARGDFDYIIDVRHTSKLYDSYSKNRDYRKFMKLYGDAMTIEFDDIKIPSVQDEYLSLFDEWKEKIGPKAELNEGEYLAVKQLLKEQDSIDMQNLYYIGLRVAEKLVGFCIAENLGRNYGIGHFAKTLKSYKGVGVTLDKLVAEKLIEKGVIYFNHEQDLDVEGLRESKLSRKPVKFLKKYTIEFLQ